MGSSREQLLSRAFVGLADTLIDDYDIIELLDRLVGYSVELLAADAAGIMLADAHRKLRVVASSREDAKVMELLQLQSDQGPCMDCCRTGAPVSVPNLADAAGRWPVFVAAVAERGAYRSVYALPLRLRGEAIGAMNLFHGQPGPYPRLTWRWVKRWPTSPRSGSCPNAPSGAVNWSPNSCRPR
ncbi:MAG: GAF domain-containing protein [Pseudonocardiaceae bacterium]